MRKAVKQIIDPGNLKVAFTKLKCHLMESQSSVTHRKQDVVSVIFS